MKAPNLFIVGQPKSGTTTLYNILHHHADVYMSPNKEPNFFNIDVRKESVSYHGTNLYFDYTTETEYAQLYAGAGTQKFIGESTTGYLHSQVAAEKIFEYSPDAHIVIMLREPISFLQSLHQQFVIQGFEDETDFEKALMLEGERKEGRLIPKNVRAPSILSYMSRAKNYDQIQRYTKHFPVEQIHYIVFEDFCSDMLGVTNGLLKALNMQSYDDLDFLGEYAKNGRKSIRSNVLMKFFRNPRLTYAVRNVLPEGVYFFLKKIIDTFLYSKGSTSTVSDIVVEKLKKELYTDIHKTSKGIGIDLVDKRGYEDFG